MAWDDYHNLAYWADDEIMGNLIDDEERAGRMAKKRLTVRKAPKVVRKFYVGAPDSRMRPGWMKDTLEEAIEHGKELMEEEGHEVVRIVEVIRILRRRRVPIIVEKV